MNGWDLHFLFSRRTPPHSSASLPRLIPQFSASSTPATLITDLSFPTFICGFVFRCSRTPIALLFPPAVWHQRAFVRIRFVELFKHNTTNLELDSVSFVNLRSHRRQRLPDTHTQELRISPFAVSNELQFEYPSTRMELPLAAANRFVFDVVLTTSFLRIYQTPLASPEPTATSTISCTRSTTPTSLTSSLRRWPQGIDFLYHPILFASLSFLRHMCVFSFRILPEPVMAVFVHFTG